ncbi:ABC transporter permease [Mycobacteroides abscessus]|uniref:ABC transporter permease n=1 Tax=Mycobacteroides abscessus TaxID=36809 RepID=UPI000C25B289|nr:ABC transporter permease subunit [Mycobacteroides abscessus]
MLLWNRWSRLILWSVFAVMITVVFIAPIATVVLAGFSGAWTGPLPTQLGFMRYEKALGGDDLASMAVSLQTAVMSSGLALLLGTWAALSVREVPSWLRRVIDAVFHLPIAIPSVAIGLGLLMAFNEPPFLLGGTKWIVIVAHTALVLAFAFSSVSAALERLDPAYRQVAESLGAGSVRVVRTVTLPLLLPSLGAAAGLAIALSMGELGATVMVYPSSWRTLPVTIFGLSDRGQVFSAAASTTLLLMVTLLALLVVGRLRGKVAFR